MCRVLPLAPLDLVDLLLDLKGLEVVKLGLVRLELSIEFVFASFFLRLRTEVILVWPGIRGSRWH